MRYSRYPKYTESGIDWLGRLPAHWKIERLKFIAQRKDLKMEAVEESPLPYVGMEHVESWSGRLLPLDAESIPEGVSNRFYSGDILFGKLRPYLAKVCNPDFDGLCSSELLVLKRGARLGQSGPDGQDGLAGQSGRGDKVGSGSARRGAHA